MWRIYANAWRAYSNVCKYGANVCKYVRMCANMSRMCCKVKHNKTQRSTMRLQATFSFFIILQLFHFFTLLVAPSPRRSFSSSLLPPRCSFLLVPASSLSLLPPRPSFFLPRPALSQSLRIHKRPFFIKFDESVTNRGRDGRTNAPTDGQGLI